MIRGIHGLFYSSDPDATRAFFKEKVKLPGTDIGQGWWIFDLPEGDLGVHPVDDSVEPGGHHLSFYCDDIHGTVADMKARGVRFSGKVEDRGWGLVTEFKAPGGVAVQLYEPRYTKGAPKGSRKASSAKKAPTKRARAAKRSNARPKKR
jgi:hypothetical protein